MLAKKIGWSFVELNKEIEAQNGLSVAEIIALYGQEGFRRMEQAALGQLLARKELMVLATGGGIVSEPLTFDLILSSFYTIWLKAEPEEHMARVRRQGDLRPMADDRSAMAELRNILVSREPLYARASAVVDTAGLTRRCRGGAADRCGGAGAAAGRADVRAGLSRAVRSEVRPCPTSHFSSPFAYNPSSHENGHLGPGIVRTMITDMGIAALDLGLRGATAALFPDGGGGCAGAGSASLMRSGFWPRPWPLRAPPT